MTVKILQSPEFVRGMLISMKATEDQDIYTINNESARDYKNTLEALKNCEFIEEI